MPQVPRYERQVLPEVTVPQATGQAPQMVDTRLTKQALSGIDTVTQIATKEKARADDMATKMWYNQVLNEKNKLAAEWQKIKGHQVLQGDFMANRQEEWDGVVQSANQNLHNRDQREFAAKMEGRLRAQETKAWNSHFATQVDFADQQTNKVTRATAIENAAKNFASPEVWEQSMIDINAIAKDDYNKGRLNSQKAVDLQIKVDRSEMGRKMIISMADDSENSGLAKKKYDEIRDRYADFFTMADKKAIERALKSSGLKGRAQAATDEIMAMNLGWKESVEYAKREYADKPEDRDEIVRRVNSNFALEERMLSVAKRKNYDASLKIAKTAGDADAIPEWRWNMLDYDQQNKVYEMVGDLRDNKTVTTTGAHLVDYGTWRAKMYDPRTANEAAERDINNEINNWSPYHRKQAQQLIDDFKEQKDEFIKKRNSFLKNDQMIKNSFRQASIKPDPKTRNYRLIMDDIEEYSDYYYEKHGTYPDLESVQKRVDFLLTEIRGGRIYQLPEGRRIEVHPIRVPKDKKIEIEHLIQDAITEGVWGRDWYDLEDVARLYADQLEAELYYGR